MIDTSRFPAVEELHADAGFEPNAGKFLLIWAGQLVSIVGSGLTSFALGIWMFQATGSVTRFALISICFTLPAIISFPLAGVVVDRVSRRKVMIASDLAAGFSTLLLALLFFLGRLSLWEICLLVCVGSIAEAFRLPSYTAIVGQMVPARNIGRASGLLQFGPATAQVVAPALAAILMGSIGVKGILLVDFLTFIIAISTLLAVDVPVLRHGPVESSIFRDTTEGWRFISTHPGLLALLSLFFIINLTYSVVQILLPPIVLSLKKPEVLGVIMSLGAVGYLFGSTVMVLWKGPRKHIHGLLVSALVYAVGIVLAAITPSTALITVAVIIIFSQMPVMNTCSQAIWLFTVPQSMQGRVFSTRMMLAWSSIPLAFFLAAPLADRIFEPLLHTGGELAKTWISCIGVGPGRGTALLLLLDGVLALFVVAAYCLRQPFRNIGSDLEGN